MANFNDLIEQVLYEKKQSKSTSIFYNIDVFIQEFEKEPEQQPEPKQQPEPEQQQENTKENTKILNEEIFKFKGNGIINVPLEDAKSIIKLEDVINYMNKVDTKENDIINDLVIELILSLTTENTEKAAEEIINEGDKLNITIDYGFDKKDSIGFQIAKNSGTKIATVLLRKNGKPESGKFSEKIFNDTIANIYLQELG